MRSFDLIGTGSFRHDLDDYVGELTRRRRRRRRADRRVDRAVHLPTPAQPRPTRQGLRRAALADSYNSIVGGDLVPGDDDGWVEVHTPAGRLAFQQVDDHRRPTWPGGDVPQPGHIDNGVGNLDGAETAVLRLGAEKAATQPSPDQFQVMIDPAGHPFCLVHAE